MHQPSKQWSASLQQQTRTAIASLDLSCFNPLTGCMHFKSHNKLAPYGRITAKDLSDGRLLLRDEQGTGIVEFSNVDELLAAGWAVD